MKARLHLRVCDVQCKQASDIPLGCSDIASQKMQPCSPIEPQLLYVVATYRLVHLAVNE